MNRHDHLALLREYVQSVSLQRHMFAVEAGVAAYARKWGEDEQLWAAVGLLHDFDYERWPNPRIIRSRAQKSCGNGATAEELIYAILSHADYLQADYPRKSRLDKTLYACDELCGFIVACALMRPERLAGMTAKSVRKKMKQASFAAAVSRDDIIRGAADLGVDLDEHITFLIAALQPLAAELDLLPAISEGGGEAVGDA
ncbi:MAG UNVERIFIED_CONTAM: HAD family hydrolase [Planctomycetaceae bacterium]|jgi:predicted hydrolase (HD superfamily)